MSVSFQGRVPGEVMVSLTEMDIRTSPRRGQWAWTDTEVVAGHPRAGQSRWWEWQDERTQTMQPRQSVVKK